MCQCKLFYFCVSVLCNVLFVTSFNIDNVNYAVYEWSNAAMFGFTVAVHKDGGDGAWVLVGAPEAQSRFHYQNEVTKGGAVFRCNPDEDNTCTEIRFDKQPSNNRYPTERTMIDNKSYQWFGATLSTSGQIDGPVVACAPRYVWFTRNLNRKDPVGTCFVSNGALNEFEEYSPCRTTNWGYHRQGSCQAGFSAAINKDGDRLYVGAPGSYYWQGQMYSIDAHANFSFTPSFFGNLGYGAKGSVQQKHLENRPAVFSTREGSPPDDDSYMGYSTVAGHFKENEQYEGIAVGMPRGNSLRGKVLLFTWNLKNYKNITISKQIGSYFGYSITAADVNGDKRLDIIVGAPMHTEPNNEMKYDVGRVYIFYQSRDEYESFNSFHFIDGTNSKARFGHAVSTLGDLNQDGFDDFAIGAPYDGPNGRGAVYIYYGSEKGIRKKYGQVIYAESIESQVPLKTFGFSLAGGMDLDGNEFPDMAVGAYLSDSAFFFRSRPVVLVDASVRYQTSQNQIDIRRLNCRHNGQNATCTDIKFCMKYTGKGIPGQMEFIVEYILDSKKANTPRMGFYQRGSHTFNNTLRLAVEKETCETYQVYIQSEIRDKLTPLEAKVNYYLVESDSSKWTRNPRSALRPVLDLNSPPSRKDTLIIQKNCGDDNICIPDLHLNVTSKVQKHLLGSGDDLVLNVVVSNFGEDSFETVFNMNYSKGIHLRIVETDPHLPPVLCSPGTSNNTLTCDIGNPLPKGGIAKFSILFQPPIQEEGVALTYDFDVYADSANPEDNNTRKDNHRHIAIDISVDASIELRGDSYPSSVYYNESLYTSEVIIKETDIGPQVTHVYYLTNRGPSIIREAEMYILWPHRSLGDEDLLYLLEQPHTKGDVKCDAYQQYIDAEQLFQLSYNHKHYELDYHTASIWDRLKIDTSNVGTETEQKITETGKGVHSGEGVESTNININQTGDSSGVFIERYGGKVKSNGTIETSGTITTSSSRYYTEVVNGVNRTTWENITTVKDASGNILAQSLTLLENGIPKTMWQNFTTIRDKNGNILARSRTTFDNGISNTAWDNATFFQNSFFENSRPGSLGGGWSSKSSSRQGTRVYQGTGSTNRGQGGTIETSGIITTTSSRYYTEVVNGVNRTTWENITTVKDASGNILAQSLTLLENGIPKTMWQNFTTIRDKNGNILARSRTTFDNGISNTAWDNATFFQNSFFENSRPGSLGGGWSSKSSSRQGTRVYQGTGSTNRGQGIRYNEEENRSYHVNKYSGGQQVGGHRVPERLDGQESSYEGNVYAVGGGPREGGAQNQYGQNQFQGQYGQSQFQEQHRQGLQEQSRQGQHASSHGQVYGSERFNQGSYQQNIGEREQGQYEQHGVYPGSSGHVVYNKTWTVEGSTSIPIVLSGQEHTQQQLNEIALGRGFRVQFLDADAASESSIAAGVAGGTRDGNVYTQDGRNLQEGYGQGQSAYGQQSGNTYYQSRNTYNQGGGAHGSGHSRNEGAYGHSSGISNSDGRIRQDYDQEGSSRSTSGQEYSGTWHVEGSSSQNRKIPPTIVQNNIERDNVATDRPNPNQRYRGKRMAANFFDEILSLQNCGSTKCSYIRCVVGTLEKDKEVAILLRSRLNVRAVKNVTSSQAVKLSSMAIGRISRLPYIGVPKEEILRKHEIFTEVPAKETELVPEVAPLWIYVVSAVAGVIMLLLLIWILSKCGFFKRNRPSSAPERQPLNRNGYHSGDEAL